MATSGYLAFDTDGRIVHAEAATMALLADDLPVGMPFQTRLSSGDRSRFAALLEQLFSQAVPQSCRLTLGVGATVRAVRLDAMPSADGTQCLALITDISEAVAAEAGHATVARRLAALLATEPECVKLLARDGSLLEMNEAGLKMVQADSFEEIAHRSIYPLIAAEHRQAFEDLNHRVFAGEPGMLEFQIVGLKGRLRWMETHVRPLLDADGNITAALGVTRDVTERVEREAHLRLLESCIACVNDIVLITEAAPADAPGPRILFVNDAFEKLTGYARAEVIGQSPRLLQGPGTDRRQLDRIRAAVVAQEPVRVELVNYAKSGQAYLLEIDMVPILSAAGVATHFVAIERDITARRKTEQALADSELRLASVIDSAMDAIISVDADQKIVLFNRAAEAMFGYRADELLGTGLDRLIPSALRAQHRGHIERYGTTATSSRAMGALGQLRALRADGTEFSIEASISHDEVAGRKRFTVILRDVTARKAAEEVVAIANQELARSNLDLEQFAYAASHDLQEPLRAVGSCLQLLQLRYRDKIDARADEFIDHAVSGSRRMQLLIYDLLTYSRIGAKAQAFEPVDTTALFKKACANLRIAMAEAKVELSCDPLPMVNANAQQVVQLFQNLLGNALKFRGSEPARVHVGVQRSDATWIFSVQDHGIGIKEEHFNKIFQLFKRLHTREEYPGTGIGLTICLKIIERHGGRIWVESASGSGATFYFSLPAVMHEKAVSA